MIDLFSLERATSLDKTLFLHSENINERLLVMIYVVSKNILQIDINYSG
jgi:hypothetical protein